MGKYDIPAIAKYILNTKKNSKNSMKMKITYVGHSQGTSQYFSGMTLLPEFYLQTFTGIIALGPVTNLANIRSMPIRLSADLEADKLFDDLGITEMVESSEAADKISTFLCSNFNLICDGFLKLLVDGNLEDDDSDRSLVLLAHFPSGTSLKSFTHLAHD